MDKPTYPFIISDDRLDYTFKSLSEKRTVDKLVQFRPFPDNAIFYNMALLDILEEGKVDDLIVTDNQDMPIVLATVVKALSTFFERYPRKLVHFRGSDAKGVRTRLYRAVISRELDKAQTLFHLYGQLASGEFEDFVSNRPYQAFIIQKK